MDDQTGDSTIQDNADKLDQLSRLAVSLGAGAAVVLPVEHVSPEDGLAALCKETRCENYGLSPTCPPHVKGPAWLREQLPSLDHAMLIKLELPSDEMYSEERREIGKLMHFMVIQLEQAAREAGFEQAMAFAGGSCKKLFCTEEKSCRVLHGNGICRHPDSARPSVSGYGINMNHLLKAAGWDKPDRSMSSYYGLVLLSRGR